MDTYTDAKGVTQTQDTRNIDEKYRWWDHDDIVADLDTQRSELVSVFYNTIRDLNLGTAIRSNSFFLANDIYLVSGRVVDDGTGRTLDDGRVILDNGTTVGEPNSKRWDRRGAVGSHLYQHLKYAVDMEDVINDLRGQGYRIVAAELDDRAVSLPSYQWEKKSAIIYGEEGISISDHILDMVDDVVQIPRRGTVRSLNLAATSSLINYDYSVKTGYIN